jgi:serine/threonine protein kinase
VTTLSPDDWQRAKAIIADALDQPAASRHEWVERALQDTPELRETVEALLAEADDEASDGFLSRPAALDEISTGGALATERLPPTGTLIGAWRLVREIGRGGMGVIFLAERADGSYQQQAALKLLRTAGRSRHRDAVRMARERQSLASLQHPNIARLIDGGETADGAPYLVLEYIEGETIDAYCTARNLGVRARIALVEKVAAAVQSAHQQLVVHRDIKPSNVLVGKDGEPKLLDFGIARLLESPVSGETTHEGALLFTPRYASPEQVSGMPVSVATDVYGLGALLYALLTHAGPYARLTSTEATNVAAVMRIVAEDPLSLASDMAQQSKPDFASTLKGDLDLILAKACARDVALRYATVADLAADLARWQQGKPITARAPSLAYALRKFVGRHRVGTALGAVALAAVAAGVIGTMVQKREAERQYAKSRQIINTFIFKYYDALAPLSQTLSIRKDLVKDGLKYLDELSVADNDFSGHLERGMGYMKLSHSLFNGRNLAHLGDRAGGDAAATKARDALAHAARLQPGTTEVEAALARLSLREADVLWQDGKVAEASAIYLRTADAMAQILARDTSDKNIGWLIPYALMQVAVAENRAGKNVDAVVSRARASTAAYSRLYPNTDEALDAEGYILQREIVLATDRKDYAAAVKVAAETVALLEKNLPRRADRINAIRVLQSVYNNYSFTAGYVKDFDTAIRAGQKAVEWAEVIRSEEPDSADAVYKLAAAEYVLARAAFKSTTQNELAIKTAERAIATFELLSKRDMSANQQRHYAVTIELWWDSMQQAKAYTLKPRIQAAMARYAQRFPEAIKQDPVKGIHATVMSS